MSGQVHSRVDYDYHSAQQSVNLISKAIEKGTLPGRAHHALGLVLQTPFVSSFTLISRVCAFASNGLSILSIPCSDSNHKLGLLAYRLIRLVALDPLYILSGVIIAIARIAGDLLGIIAPCAGARLFKLAAQLEALNLYVKWSCHARLVEEQPMTKERFVKLALKDRIQYLNKLSTLCLDPSIAEQYLTRAGALKIAEGIRKAAGWSKKAVLIKTQAEIAERVNQAIPQLVAYKASLGGRPPQDEAAPTSAETEQALKILCQLKKVLESPVELDAKHIAEIDEKSGAAGAINERAVKDSYEIRRHEAILKHVTAFLNAPKAQHWHSAKVYDPISAYPVFASESIVYKAGLVAP